MAQTKLSHLYMGNKSDVVCKRCISSLNLTLHRKMISYTEFKSSEKKNYITFPDKETYGMFGI